MRVKCNVCGTTHAIIPSFSLPGTSIGTEDAENYFLLRRNNISRQIAAKSIYSKGIRSFEHPKNLDKLLEKTINRAKAIFTEVGDHCLNGLAWIESVVGKGQDPITSFNNYCLSQNVNCIFFIRYNAIIFKKNKSENAFSHDNTPDNYGDKGINSS